MAPRKKKKAPMSADHKAALAQAQEIDAWYLSGWNLIGVLIGFLLMGFAFDLAIHVWRITHEPAWQHRRRTFSELFLPACCLSLVFFIGWAGAMRLEM